MTPRLILIGGWLTFVVFAYPGYMTIESIDQLMDARVGAYTDWHAPMMSAIWRAIDGRVIAGPAGMLFLQSVLFVAGTYWLLRRVQAKRHAAIAAAASLCFPPIATTLAVISRDAQLSGFLLAGTAAMLSDRRAVRIGGLVLVFLGATMRDAGIVAALPLVVGLFRWNHDDHRWRRIGIAAAAWVIIFLGATATNRWLPDSHSERQELLLAQHDILGVIRYTEATSDEALHEELARAGLGGVMPAELHAAVRPLYRYPDHWSEVLPLPARDDAHARTTFLRARTKLVRAHPGAYLKHRGLQLRLLLGLAPMPDWQPVYTSFVEKPEHRHIAKHRATHSWLQNRFIGVAEHTPDLFYRPYLYALLALVMLPLAILRRQRVAGLLLVSGLAYQLTLGFLIATPGYRHSSWMTACTLLATVMLAAQEVRRRRSGRRPLAPTA